MDALLLEIVLDYSSSMRTAIIFRINGEIFRFRRLLNFPVGHIITINTNPKGLKNCVTRKGETDVVIINIETGDVVKKLELISLGIIQKRNAHMSSCRFLSCDGINVYVVDLGLHQIYRLTIDWNTKALIKHITFGKCGRNKGQFIEPAGLAVDSCGNMIIADAGNHRLQVFDKECNYIAPIHIRTKIKRPSGIMLDIETASLYILNLRGNSLVKVKLLKQPIS